MQVWCDWQLTLCDPHLSALEVRFHDDALYKSMFTFTFTYGSTWLVKALCPYLTIGMVVKYLDFHIDSKVRYSVSYSYKMLLSLSAYRPVN